MSDTKTFTLQVYYKTVGNISSASLQIADISHNLSSAFNLYATSNTIFIRNNNITSVNDNYKIYPISAYKQYALTYSGIPANAANPIMSWNANKVWGVGTLSGIQAVFPTGGNTICSLIPVPTSQTDITVNSVRVNSITTLSPNAANTVGGNLSESTGSTSPYVGNIITFPASYSASGIGPGSNPVATSGVTDVPNSTSHYYVNLATVYLTFQSSIC